MTPHYRPVRVLLLLTTLIATFFNSSSCQSTSSPPVRWTPPSSSASAPPSSTSPPSRRRHNYYSRTTQSSNSLPLLSFVHSNRHLFQRSTPILFRGTRCCGAIMTSSCKQPTLCMSMSSSSSSSSSSSQSYSNYASSSPWAPGTWEITLDFGRDDSSSSTTATTMMPSTSLFESTQQQQQQQQSNSLKKENDDRISSLLGEEWGSSGGRLVLSFDVTATTDTDTTLSLGNNNSNGNSNNNKQIEQLQSAWLGGKPTGTIQCLPINDDETDETIIDGNGGNNNNNNNNNNYYCTTYINTKGQQKVQISPGQWRIEPPQPLSPQFSKTLSGQASILRFHLTIQNPIERNTIIFPENQILFLQCNTFRLPVYRNGIQTILPYQYAKESTQQTLEERLDHETGDRRLDGTDFLETMEGYKDVAGLVWERDEAWRRWRDVEGVLPKLSKDNRRTTTTTTTRLDIESLLQEEDRWGIWPGDVEPMTIERGVILAVVSKSQGGKDGSSTTTKGGGGFFSSLMGGGGNDSVHETVVVGRWSAVPVFDDDYYDEDEDEDDER